jgi:hypothetical protein
MLSEWPFVFTEWREDDVDCCGLALFALPSTLALLSDLSETELSVRMRLAVLRVVEHMVESFLLARSLIEIPQ